MFQSLRPSFPPVNSYIIKGLRHGDFRILSPNYPNNSGRQLNPYTTLFLTSTEGKASPYFAKRKQTMAIDIDVFKTRESNLKLSLA